MYMAAVLLALGPDGQEEEVVAVAEADVLESPSNCCCLCLFVTLFVIYLCLVVVYLLCIALVYYVLFSSPPVIVFHESELGLLNVITS